MQASCEYKLEINASIPLSEDSEGPLVCSCLLGKNLPPAFLNDPLIKQHKGIHVRTYIACTYKCRHIYYSKYIQNSLD